MRQGDWALRVTTGLAAVAVAVLTGCGHDQGRGADTCSGGSNMENVRVVAESRATGDTQVTITWDQGTGQGARLPASYFDAVELASTGPQGDARFEPDRTIVVTLSNAAPVADGGSPELSFVLVFPDRAEVIDCDHPGMKDQYFLTVTLTRDASGALTGSAKESVSLGAI